MLAPGYRPRASPAGLKTELCEHLAAELDQVRIAAMAGIRTWIGDFGFDAGGALAQHDEVPSSRLISTMSETPTPDSPQPVE
jgi:hypothetical protein